MAKKFEISDTRFLVVKKGEMKLFEKGTSKMALFTFQRWAQFAEQFTEIDESVIKLVAKQDVRLQLHIGGGWYVSVTSGYWCVDIRKFYYLPDVGAKATKTGIALRLYEWARLKEIVGEINKIQKIAEAQPCWTDPSHFTSEGAAACRECNPFGLTE